MKKMLFFVVFLFTSSLLIAGCDRDIAGVAIKPAEKPELDNVIKNISEPEGIGTIFVTFGGYNGDLGGLAGADVKCTQVANNAGWEGSWTALLSTSYINAKDRIPDAVFRRTSDNRVVADNKVDLFDGIIDNKISTVYGYYVTGGAWTGSHQNGVYYFNETCDDWTTNSSNVYGREGVPFYTDSRWIDYSDGRCSWDRRLYCVHVGRTSQTHSACVDLECVAANGPGGDECSSNSECLSSEACYDTDGGINYYELGRVFLYGNFSSLDFCKSNSRIINEFYCNSEDEIENISYSCPFGRCENGECVTSWNHVCTAFEECSDVYEYEMSEGDEVNINDWTLRIENVFYSLGEREDRVSLSFSRGIESETVSLKRFSLLDFLDFYIQPIFISSENNSVILRVAPNSDPDSEQYLSTTPPTYSCNDNNLFVDPVINYECDEGRACDFSFSQTLIETCSEEEYCLDGVYKCLSHNPSNAEITDDKKFIINSEEIFPLGYWLSVSEYSIYLNSLKNNGFNLVVFHLVNGYDLEARDTYLKACSLNLEAASEVGLYSLLLVDPRPELFDQDPAIREKVIRDIVECSSRSHSFIGYASDEPAWRYFLQSSSNPGNLVNLFTPEEHNLLFENLKEADPYNHIVWINHAPTTNGERPLVIENYVRDINAYYFADVKSIDVYPEENRVTGHCFIPDPGVPEKISCVGEYTDILNEAVNGRTPVGMVLAIRDSERDRIPFKYMRFMAYQAIVHGAKGLMWWEVGHSETIDIVRELSSIENVLISEDAEEDIIGVGNDNVKILLKRNNEGDYLISVNELDEDLGEVEFYNLDNYDLAEVLFEDRSISIENGIFIDYFEDYGVHVYFLRKRN
jgi:hypothetical protein